MKTAVEWLVEQMKQRESQGLTLSMYELEMFAEQAKEMEEAQNFELGKRCFYKGFERAKNDDGNCFISWREEAPELLTFKSE